MKQVYLHRVETPLGVIWLLATGRGVCSIQFEVPRRRTLGQIPASPSRKELVSGGTVLRRAAREINEYLEGKRRRFSVRLDLSGFSSFDRSVLNLVRRIPYGETRPYVWIATQLGNPRLARRVQGLLAKNPLPILVPCHRAVAMGGLGYHVAGRSLKRALIEIERGQIGLGFGGAT